MGAPHPCQALTTYTYHPTGLLLSTTTAAATGDIETAQAKADVRQLQTTNTYQLSTLNLQYGCLQTTTDTSGMTTTYAYDTKGRLQYEQYTDGTGLYYTYDALGRTHQVLPWFQYMFGPVTGAEEVTYTYNACGYLATVTTAPRHTPSPTTPSAIPRPSRWTAGTSRW